MAATFPSVTVHRTARVELAARFVDSVKLAIAERSSEALPEHSGDSGG